MSDPIRLHIKELKPNPWGAYLVLVDDREDWHLPLGLRPPIAEAVRAQLAGGGDMAVPSLIQGLLNFVKGELARVEITLHEGGGWIRAHAVVVHDGQESTLPIRLHDGALLARREGLPLTATAGALRVDGIRKGETVESIGRADVTGLKRFTMGCLAIGRLNEGMAACRVLLDVVEPRFREVWRAWMGDYFQLKGLPRRAAEEYAAAISWEIRYGDYISAVRIAGKMGAIKTLADDPVTLRSPAVVEDFEDDRLNNILSGSSDAATLPAPGRPGGRARQFTYDLNEYCYPWLHLAFPDTQVWHGAQRVCWDIHLDSTTGTGSLALEFGIDFGDALAGKYVAPPFTIVPGWNSLAVSLRDPVWRKGDKAGIALDADPLESVLGVQVVLSAEGKSGTGTIAITNIRIE